MPTASALRALKIFALFGGGQGDGLIRGRPKSQLAVLPDTLHINMLARTDLIVPILVLFLDK
jgi:hypothetical protein